MRTVKYCMEACLCLALAICIGRSGTVVYANTNGDGVAITKSIKWENVGKGIARVTIEVKNKKRVPGEKLVDQAILRKEQAVVVSKANELFVMRGGEKCEKIAYRVLPESLLARQGSAKLDEDTNEITWSIGTLPMNEESYTLSYEVMIALNEVSNENTIYVEASTLWYEKEEGNEETPSISLETEQEDITFYRVVFRNKDHNKTVVKSQYVAANESAALPEDPTLPETAKYSYTFTGWAGNYSNVTKDEVVEATYKATEKLYTVTFVDADGLTILGTDTVPYKGKAVYRGKTPTKTPEGVVAYEFNGWDKAYTCVTKNLTVTATYLSYVMIDDPTTLENYNTVEEDPIHNPELYLTKNTVPSKTDQKQKSKLRTAVYAKTLPKAGTVSVAVFYVLGGILVTAGIVMLKSKKRDKLT